MNIDQTHAELNPLASTINGLRYTQRIKGWSGSGFSSSFWALEGRYVNMNNEAQIEFMVIDRKGERDYRHIGSLVLQKEDAIKFALAITPPEFSTAQKKYPDLLQAVEEAFLAFGRMGGNSSTGNPEIRKQWEAMREALRGTGSKFAPFD